MKICDIPGVRFLGICPKHEHKASHVKTATDYVILISRIALGIIAAMTALQLFLPFFAGGAAWSMYQNHYPDTTAHHHHHHDPFSVVGCGEYMQTIAGREFPAEANLVANLSITICHIDHHAVVFVPYSALSTGMWIGDLVDQPLSCAASWLAAKLAF